MVGSTGVSGLTLGGGLGYLEDDAIDPAKAAYGVNLPRLREIKASYDPDNFFRHNVNIQPA